MSIFEQTLLQEVAGLPPNCQTDVLAFVRYLKFSMPAEEWQISERFDAALKSIRARAENLGITQEDIEAEIRAVREENARCS